MTLKRETREQVGLKPDPPTGDPYARGWEAAIRWARALLSDADSLPEVLSVLDSQLAHAERTRRKRKGYRNPGTGSRMGPTTDRAAP